MALQTVIWRERRGEGIMVCVCTSRSGKDWTESRVSDKGIETNREREKGGEERVENTHTHTNTQTHTHVSHTHTHTHTHTREREKE